MAEDRRLTWDNCTNVRDLGGLKTRDGHVTRRGAVVRSDHPARLTAEGWSALHAHGVRTIISLGTEGMTEDKPDTAPRPGDITTVSVNIEDVTDHTSEFVQRWGTSDLWCTPLYYRDALKHWPERHANALKAIAHAQPGGVLFHCVRGVDRTGIVALLLLALVGVEADDIIADYELSVDPEREKLLAGENTTTREVLLNTLAALDVETYLRKGGMSQADLDALRARFLESSGAEDTENA
ncbi:MAG: tyrosine-protein phosphatase [Anaerolineae bacterium]|nr:tyrosine-protein phosphatase [Anaerolineae bacterium]